MWTVFNLLKRFFSDLSRATMFALIEYDEKLQTTKTTGERILIWVIVGAFVAVLCAGGVFLFWRFLDAINFTGF